MSVWAAILLGFIQGLTEFLPVSSSGHLSVLQNLFGFQTAEEGHLLFDVLLHLGTLISVCVVYWQDIREMACGFAAFFRRGKKGAGTDSSHIPAARLLLMIILATLPLFLVLPINDYIEQLYYNTFFIGAALILTGCLLYAGDRMPKGPKNEKTMTVGNALVIGLCQAVAVIPGLSRSGTTITAGMATGLNREFAVKFSFLLSLPAIIGANILTLAKSFETGIDVSLIPAYLIGMATAMLTGIAAIGFVRVLARKAKFGSFAYYCWTAGLLTIILSLIF